MPEVEVPLSGALSIDQAVAALDRKDKPQDAPQEAAPATPKENTDNTDSSEAAPTADDTPAADTPSESEDATEEAPAEGEQPEQPAIDPPQFWDAEAKKRFGELPRDVQEVILKNEQTRNAATSKAIQEQAEKRKAAEAIEQRLGQYTQALDRLIPQATQTFKNRWEGVDWNATIDQLGADQAMKLRTQMEAEQQQVQQLMAAKQQADDYQYNKFVEAEQAKLPEYAPDLADPKEGANRRLELANWLVKTGVNPQVLKNLSALETSLAYDAMRWRNAQAKAKTLASQPKQPAAQPVRQSVKPTATQAPRNPQSARLQELNRKKSLTTDEAVELLNLRT